MAETMNETTTTTTTETDVTNAEVADALNHLEHAIQTFARWREQLATRGLNNEFASTLLDQFDDSAFTVESRFWAYWKAAEPGAAAADYETNPLDADDDDDEDDE